jgi:ABC-2 type transport system permease protein
MAEDKAHLDLKDRSHIREHGGKRSGIVWQTAELWRYRELVLNLTLRDLKVKYKRSLLGFLWTLVNPIIVVGVLVSVFSYIVRIPLTNYWAFLISNYFIFNFVSMSINGGVQSALGNAYLTRTAYFPQEVLVVSSTLARFMEFCVEFIIVLAALIFFHHKTIPYSFVVIFPLLPILFLFTLGITLPLVAVSVYFRDAVQIIPLLTMVLFYISPVFYTVDMIPDDLKTVYLLNPMAKILSATHHSLYWGKMPKGSEIVLLATLSFVTSLAGYLIFNCKKREFAEIV